MKVWAQRFVAAMAATTLALPGVQPGFTQSTSSSQSNQPSGFVLKMNGELVLTNVVVRDAKTGEVVKDLKKSDFSIYENGKQQQIETFDFESVDQAAPLN